MNVGIGNVVSTARRLGITADLPPVESLAIGTGEITLLELVSAYSVFANGGFYNQPIFVTRITDREGRIIEENRPQPREVLSPQVAYMMNNLLSSVIRNGSGQNAHRYYGFHWPAAGKTGTTDNQTDAWFTGFTPNYVAGCWVGFDLLETLGKRQTGAVVALPIWANFMRRAHEGLTPIDFPIPPGIIHKQICQESFQLATDNCPNTQWETFIEGTEPEGSCSIHAQILAGAEFNHNWLWQMRRKLSDRDLDF
jgi:penicillin-binding protein 1A